MSDTPPSTTIPERQFAEKLGVPADRLRVVRKQLLNPKVDYVQKGKELHLSETGQQSILTHLGLNTEVPAPLSDYVEIEVKKTVINPRIILGCVVGTLKIVRCRVHNNAKFIPGMRLNKCRLVADGLYQFEGRAPRFRGKW
jgi:hypothetical protein